MPEPGHTADFTTLAASSNDPAGIPGDMRISMVEWSKIQRELTRLRAVEAESVRMYEHNIGCDMCDTTACMEDPQRHPALTYPAIAAAARAQAQDDSRCPRCDSPAPDLHPAVQHGGEVQPCDHAFHAAQAGHEVQP